MKTMKLFFLPMLLSSSFVLNNALADSEMENRAEHAASEVREEAHEGMAEAKDGMHEAKQESKQAWKNVKHESKEMWRDTKSAFSEGVLEGKLEMAILLNKHLNPFDIDIDVQGDKAVLEGQVSSDVEKDLAESIAKGIEGIDSVDNRLAVDSKLSAKHNQKVTEDVKDKDRNFSQFFADVSTTAAIKTELLANDNIKGLDVNVDTFNNRVTLTGEVKTQAQKSLAESIAKKRDDVTEVVNRLRVNS